jgi:ferrous iron transport protein B
MLYDTTQYIKRLKLKFGVNPLVGSAIDHQTAVPHKCQKCKAIFLASPDVMLNHKEEPVCLTWEKGAQYLKKMGGIIMIASIIIWFLGYYPQHDAYESVAEQQKNSYIGQIGKAIEPVIKPLGFDWKLGIGLISGVGAKELVVSTLGVLYTNEGDVENVNLSNRIPITPLVALAYMLFVLIYFPCIATFAAIKQESGSWKWAIFTAGYTTGLAWLIAFTVFQIGSLIV